jgi:hypothetical protein
MATPQLAPPPNSREKRAAFAFGVVFVTVLLSMAIFFPEPSAFQYQVFRIVLALAGAGVAAIIPGIFDLQTPTSVGLVIRAGGALAVFGLIYLVNPAQLVHLDSEASPPPDYQQALSNILNTMHKKAMSSIRRITAGTTPDEPEGGDHQRWNRKQWQQLLSGHRLTYMDSSFSDSDGYYTIKIIIDLCPQGNFTHYSFHRGGPPSSDRDEISSGQWEILTQGQQALLVLKFNSNRTLKASLAFNDGFYFYVDGKRYFRTNSGVHAPLC